MFTDGLKIPLFANIIFQDMPTRFNLYREFNIFPEIYFDSDSFDDLHIDAIRELSAFFRQNEIMTTIHAPFWDLFPASSDKEIRRISVMRIVTALNIANTLNAQNVVFHTGYSANSSFKLGKNEWMKRFLESLAKVIDYAQSFNLCVSLENVYEPDPSIFIEAIEAFPQKALNLCFDTGHFNVFGKTSLKEWLQAVSPRLREVHVHSNGGHDDEHGAIDSGNIDFEEIFRLMVDFKANPIITIENKTNDNLVRTVKILRSEKYFRLLNNFRPEFMR